MNVDMPRQVQDRTQLYDVRNSQSLYRGGVCSMNLIVMAEDVVPQLVNVRNGSLAGQQIVGEQCAVRAACDGIIERCSVLLGGNSIKNWNQRRDDDALSAIGRNLNELLVKYSPRMGHPEDIETEGLQDLRNLMLDARGETMRLQNTSEHACAIFPSGARGMPMAHCRTWGRGAQRPGNEPRHRWNS